MNNNITLNLNELDNTYSIEDLIKLNAEYMELLQITFLTNLKRLSETPKTTDKISIQTKMGTLAAYTSDNGENQGIFIMYQPKGIEEEVDVAYVETQPDDNENITGYIYEDETSEDYTQKFKINRKALLSSIYAEYSDEHMKAQTNRLAIIDSVLKSEKDINVIKTLAEERKTILEGLAKNAQNICLGLSDITDINE